MPWKTLLLELWNVFIVVPLLDSVNYIFNMSSFVIIADVSEIIFSEGGGGGGALSSIFCAAKVENDWCINNKMCFVCLMIIEIVLLYHFDFF